MTVYRAVPIDGDDWLEVEFEGEPVMSDESFSYSYGSIEGVNKCIRASMEEEEITWDKELYSIEENIIIENYLNADRNWLNIAEEMERKY